MPDLSLTEKRARLEELRKDAEELARVPIPHRIGSAGIRLAPEEALWIIQAANGNLVGDDLESLWADVLACVQDGRLSVGDCYRMKSLLAKTLDLAAAELTRQEREAVSLQKRVRNWVETRIGGDHMNPRERAMRLFEEASELLQAEGVDNSLARQQLDYVYSRPTGIPIKEAGGVGVCLLAYCESKNAELHDVLRQEVERIEAKSIESIRGSVARKSDRDLVTVADSPITDGEANTPTVRVCRTKADSHLSSA